MSPKLKNVSARKFISALIKDGFVLKRKSGKGSHRTYIHPTRKVKVLIPYHHSGTPLRPKILNDLIKDAGWAEEDLIRLGLMRKG